MPGPDKKELVRRYIEEAWNQGDLAVIDELFDPACESHALWENTRHYHDEQGPATAQIKASIQSWRKEVPDIHLTLNDVIDGGDRLVTRATLRGSYHGHPIRVAWIEIARVADGKIVEEWYLWDRLTYWQQLGKVPPTAELLGPDRA